MSSSTIKLCIFAMLLFTSLIVANVVYFQEKREKNKIKVVIPPPSNINLMTFGYHENLADSLWLAWSQQPEECGRERIPRQIFEANFEGYKSQYKDSIELKLGFDRDERNVCPLGWSFMMLDAITNLAPKFRHAYLVGTTVLSVLVDDHQGAAILYEKAIRTFPQDWKLYYGAAYHYLFELDDIQKAAVYLRRAGELGAPQWVFSLSSKLYTKVGQAFLGVSTLKQYKNYLLEMGDHEKIKEVDARILNLEQNAFSRPPNSSKKKSDKKKLSK